MAQDNETMPTMMRARVDAGVRLRHPLPSRVPDYVLVQGLRDPKARILSAEDMRLAIRDAASGRPTVLHDHAAFMPPSTYPFDLSRMFVSARGRPIGSACDQVLLFAHMLNPAIMLDVTMMQEMMIASMIWNYGEARLRRQTQRALVDSYDRGILQRCWWPDTMKAFYRVPVELMPVMDDPEPLERRPPGRPRGSSILRAMEDCGPMSVEDVARLAGLPQESVRTSLYRFRDQGRVRQTDEGWLWLDG